LWFIQLKMGKTTRNRSKSSSSKKRKTLADHVANFPSVANEDRLFDSRPSLDHEAVDYQNLESKVKFLLEVRNMTEWRLWPDESYIHWGYIPSPPTVILPGEKEVMSGQNAEGHFASNGNNNLFATGATGVVTWKIGDTGKKLAVMYSLPYDFDKWKNKLTVAFVDGNQKIDKIFCRRMICDIELGQCKEFGKNGQLKPIDHKSDKFHVIATMGSSHHTRIKIVLLPTNEQNYAPEYLKEAEVKEECAPNRVSPPSTSSFTPIVTPIDTPNVSPPPDTMVDDALASM